MGKARGKNSIWINAFRSGGEIEGTALKNGIKSRLSLSSINTTGVATIAYSFTAAIMALVRGRVSAAILTDGSYWVECKSSRIPERTYMLRYNPKDNRLFAVVVEAEEVIWYELANDRYVHWSIFVPRIIDIIYKDPEGEFAENYREVLKQYQREGIVKSSNEMFILNDYLYESQHEYIQHNEDINYYTDEVPSLVIKKDITNIFSDSGGSFDGIPEKEDDKPKTRSKAKTESKKKKAPEYFLEWDRKLTEEEKSLIPSLDFDIIKIPQEIKELAHMIKEEINSLKPVRNILLYGEAGAGKSTGARILAQLLGLPYRFITCSLNTEESDFIGTFKPTPDGGFEFWMPAFAETFVNGGLIEVQEPTTLKPGVGVALNSATDDTAKITLGDGRVASRHKNCIIVFTTNIDYAGCNRMNEALKDRFQQMIYMKLPNNDELVQITMEQSGNNDTALVTKLVDAIQKITIKIEEEQISGGVCSTRQLINWAQDIKYTGDVIRSAKKTILPGVSLDLEIQEEIIETILKPMF